jgi:hypothetical protein
MNARFSFSSAGRVQGAAGLFDATAQRGLTASSSGEACCCVARAVVRVVLPPTAARATVSELPGSADDPDAWFHGDSGYPPGLRPRDLAPVA